MAQNNAISSNSPDQSSPTVHSIRFFGYAIKTTVTADPSVAEKWIQQTLSMNSQQIPLVIAVTIERNPNSQRIATLQLSVKKRCLLLQLSQMGRMISEPITDFFLNDAVHFYGLKIDDFELKLFSDYGISFSRKCELLDTCDIYIRFANLVSVSCADSSNSRALCYKKLWLKELGKGILGVHLKRPKHVKESDWEAKELTKGQIKCTTATASVAFRLARL